MGGVHPVAAIEGAGKKLTEVATAWARGHQGADDDFSGIAEDMEIAGATPGEIREAREKWEQRCREERGEVDEMLIPVWPEHFDAFFAFLDLQDAWEYPDGFGGGRMTIPTSEIRATIEALGFEHPQRVFRQVKVMVRAARGVLLEQIQIARQSRGR